MPDFAFGAACLAAWLAPEAVGVRWVDYLVVLIGMEFLVIHSTGFMQWVWLADWSRANRAAYILGLGVFYSVLVGILAWAARSSWPLVGFWVLTINRMLSVLFAQAPKGSELDLVLHGWVASLALYALAVLVALVVPLPAVGLTPDLVAQLDVPARYTWAPQSHLVLAAGYLYFTLYGLSEMTDHSWVFRALRGLGRRVMRSP